MTGYANKIIFLLLQFFMVGNIKRNTNDFFGTFFLIGGIFRGAGRWGGPHHGGGPWNEDGRRKFEERAREWHQHEHGETPAAPAG